MSDRFLYHALTVGVSGRIEHPFEQIIPVQASLALPETGGFGTTRVDNFSIPGIISIAAAYSVVAGSREINEDKVPSHDALATVTIEGLNILSVVTADRIVARIASSHPENRAERSITPLGSYFENLRIGGHLVRVDLATDTFNEFDNADKVRAEYQEEHQRRAEKEASPMALHDLIVGKGEDSPAYLHYCFPWRAWKEEKIPETNGIISGSLVRAVAGLPECWKRYGHVIDFPGFGKIRLAEFKLTDSSLQVNMLQVDLGSTPKGTLGIGGVKGNGSDW